MISKQEIGSNTAKGGFANEKKICEKFNNWKTDSESQEWLKIMGYIPAKLDEVIAIQIPIRIKKEDSYIYGISKDEYAEFTRFKKADAQIRIVIKVGKILKIENLTLKKANKEANFNQIDKRSIDDYQKMWNFDDEISMWLKLFTGEIKPSTKKNLIGGIQLREERRIYIDEMPQNIQTKILDFFNKSKILVVSDVLKGKGGLSANWFLVTQYDKNENTTSWFLCDINEAMNFFGNGGVVVSPRGSFYIVRITVMRKGGTPDPTKIQFKIHPCDIFQLKQ